MKYIFITNQYLPKPGATGICVHAIAKTFAAEGGDVHVVCYNDNKEELLIDNVKIHKVAAPFHLKDLRNPSLLLFYCQRILSVLSKLIYIRRYPLRSFILSDRLYKCASRYITDSKNVVVMATYTPVEACSALIKIKREFPKVKTCFYSTDTLSNEKGDSGLLSSALRERLGRNWEYRILSIVDQAIIMECHKDHYLSNFYEDFKGKFKFANFPLIIEPGWLSTPKKVAKKKTLLYAGTLYRKLRNPSFLCQLIIKLNESIPVCSIFMGGGDCMDIMTDYSQKSNDSIHYNGMRPYEEVMAIMQEADILLSIGNKESPMAPSKIFEYMSTGKPIIHIYSWENDPCLPPLIRYGNSLLIRENDTIDINEVIHFINNSKQLKYNEVELLFRTATPQFTANIIKTIV